jgi:hypothetical protein
MYFILLKELKSLYQFSEKKKYHTDYIKIKWELKPPFMSAAKLGCKAVKLN